MVYDILIIIRSLSNVLHSRYSQMVDTVLNVSIHKGGQIVNGIVDAVVGDTSLWIIVGTYFCRSVSGRYHRFAFAGNVVNVLLVFFIIYKGTQARKGSFFILRLVTGFGTFYQDFLYYPVLGFFQL